MKNFKTNPFAFLLVLMFVFTSCQEEDIMSFEALPAVNFVDDSKTYSFLGNPDGEALQEIEIHIIGDAADRDRYFEVEVIQDEQTSARQEQYEIARGVVKAGAFSGVLPVTVFNSEELDSTSVSLHLSIKESEDFQPGNIEMRNFVLSWTNQVVLPNWQWYAHFFTRIPSSAAYRAIVESTGVTQFEMSDYRAVGPTGAEALGTQFGNYVKQYNLDNPDNPLRHDDGDLAGELIEPIYYSKSKYD